MVFRPSSPRLKRAEGWETRPSSSSSRLTLSASRRHSALCYRQIMVDQHLSEPLDCRTRRQLCAICFVLVTSCTLCTNGPAGPGARS